MSEVQSYEKRFIGGQWQTSSGEDLIEVTSPTTQEVIATVPSASAKDVDRAVAAARRAFDEGP